MNFKLQVSKGYTEVFETNPRKLKNITKIIIIYQGEGVRIKHHFVNRPFVIRFTALLWTFDLRNRNADHTSQYFLKVFQKAQKRPNNNNHK